MTADRETRVREFMMGMRLKLEDASDFLNTFLFCSLVALAVKVGSPEWGQPDRSLGPQAAQAGTEIATTASTPAPAPASVPTPPAELTPAAPVPATAAATAAAAQPDSGAGSTAIPLYASARPAEPAKPVIDAYVPPLRKRAPVTPPAPALAEAAPALTVPVPVPAVPPRKTAQSSGITVKGKPVPTGKPAAARVATGRPIDLSGRSALGAGPGMGLKCNKGLVYNPKSLMCVPTGKAAVPAPVRGAQAHVPARTQH